MAMLGRSVQLGPPGTDTLVLLDLLDLLEALVTLDPLGPRVRLVLLALAVMLVQLVLLVLLALAILVLSVPPAPLDLAATETLALLALLALQDLLAQPQASLVPTVRRRMPVVTVLLQPCTALTLVWGVLLLAEEHNALLVSFNRSILRVLAPVDITVTQALVTLHCVLILPMDT